MLSIYLFLSHLQEFPDSLKEQTYLKEWHVCNTLIQTIPAYIASFRDLTVLELSKNQISHLPVEIGKLIQDIQVFILMSFNYIAGKLTSLDILSNSLIIIFSLVSSEQSSLNFYRSLAVIILQYHVCSMAQIWGKNPTLLLSDRKAVTTFTQVDAEFFLKTGGVLCSLQVKKHRSITELYTSNKMNWNMVKRNQKYNV